MEADEDAPPDVQVRFLVSNNLSEKHRDGRAGAVAELNVGFWDREEIVEANCFSVEKNGVALEDQDGKTLEYRLDESLELESIECLLFVCDEDNQFEVLSEKVQKLVEDMLEDIFCPQSCDIGKLLCT